MSIAALLPRHVFGLKADVRDCFSYLDEQTVVYPAGANLVVYNLEQRTQRFLPATEKTEEITAMAVSANKKFIAVAEKAEKGLVTVFDVQTLKRRRLLTTLESSSKEFVSVAFSQDAKFLVALGGAPDFTLVVWIWEKAKYVASVKLQPPPNVAIYACSFAPGEGNILCVIGNGVFKQFKLTEAALKLLPNPLSKREPQNFLSHAWTSDERVVVGTDAGDVLVMDGTELKAVIPRTTPDGPSVDAILPYSKVRCGCSLTHGQGLPRRHGRRAARHVRAHRR
jgi:cilia- and flagella-associated protein 57